MNPLVTVYITNHNYGRFVAKAIDSVLNQTLRDFELIVIDDGSTDESRSVIATYENRPGVRVIFQENSGLAVSNNIAIHAARGKYVMRLDADDWLDENALAILSGVLERKPEIGMVFPDYYRVDEAGGVRELVRRHDFKTEVALLDVAAHGACTMMRVDCLREIGGYAEDISCEDGYDLWLRFIERFGVENINLPLFYYRSHGESMTRDEDNVLKTRAAIVKKHAARLERPELAAVAVIPVRGPAMDPKTLVLEKLGERRVIDWSVAAALAVSAVKRVVVTSPDAAVLAHVREIFSGESRVVAHERDMALARENSRLAETMWDVIAGHGAGCDTLVFLAAENPFRGAAYVEKALGLMRIFEVDSVIGVTLENAAFYRHTGQGLEPLRQNAELRLERDEIYRQAGGLCVTALSYFNANARLFGGRIGHVAIDKRAAMSVETPEDLDLMRFLAGRKGVVAS